MKPLATQPQISLAVDLISKRGIDAVTALAIAIHGGQSITRYEYLSRKFKKTVGSFCGLQDYIDRQWTGYKLRCISEGIVPMGYTEWVCEEQKGGVE